jgi:hypothetical protein
MFAGREPVPLCSVALAVGKDEVMAKVHWIPRPGHEVINVCVAGGQHPRAVEALSTLEIQDHRAHGGQRDTLTAKQEFMQIGDLAEDGEIPLPHQTGPACFDHVRNEGVNLLRQISNTGAQLDHCFALRVEEIQTLPAHVFAGTAAALLEPLPQTAVTVPRQISGRLLIAARESPWRWRAS